MLGVQSIDQFTVVIDDHLVKWGQLQSNLLSSNFESHVLVSIISHSILVHNIQYAMSAIKSFNSSTYSDHLYVTTCLVDRDAFTYTVIVLITTANWL